MFAPQEYENSDIETKWYMQIKEWICELEMTNANEYVRNHLIERIEENIENLKKSKWEENLIKKIELEMENIKNGRTR